MSKNEDYLENAFTKHGIQFEKQVAIKIDDYPWKTDRSRTNPKSDFYLPKYELYIEVKGFMTIEAISKMAFLSKQKVRYYIYQCTEYEWNPFIGNQNTNKDENIKYGKSKSKQLEININEQINELCDHNEQFFENISVATLSRLKDFIQKKVDQYQEWNGKWY